MVPSKHSTGGNCPVTMTPSLLPLIKHLLTDSTIFHLFDYCSTTHSLRDPRWVSLYFWIISVSSPVKWRWLWKGHNNWTTLFTGLFQFWYLFPTLILQSRMVDPFSWISVNLICNSPFHSRLHASFCFPIIIWCCFLLQMCCAKWPFGKHSVFRKWIHLMN